MNIKFVKKGDLDYPLIPMACVPDNSKYDILKIDDTYFVPLFQVIDKIAVKPDEIIKDGVRLCPNCGAKMGAVE